MTDEYDEQLKQLFTASDVDSSDEEFTSSVMNHVHQRQRHSAVFRNVACLGLLVIAWILAPYIHSGALPITLFPGEATISVANGTALAQLPILFLACLAATGSLLLNQEA